VDPAQFADGLRATDVIVESPAIRPVVVAVVLGGDLDVLPTHVEHGDQDTELVVDGDLGCGWGKAAADEQQSQPSLAR